MTGGESGMTVNEWAKDFRSFVNELQMPRDDYKGIMEYIDDAVSMLKEQEAVEPDTDSEGTCTCSNCGETVGYFPAGCSTPLKFYKFCPVCGRLVKWK